MAHACELETSIYLAIDPGAVDMSKAVDERSYPEGQHAWLDWTDGSLRIMPWWSSFSRTGVQGQPTLATEEKGKAMLDAAVAECVSYIRELKERPILGRRSPEPPS
jgi:creatinine amidohydrolase